MGQMTTYLFRNLQISRTASETKTYRERKINKKTLSMAELVIRKCFQMRLIVQELLVSRKSASLVVYWQKNPWKFNWLECSNLFYLIWTYMNVYIKKMIIIFQNSLVFLFHLYFYYSVIKFSWTLTSVSASQFFEKWDTKKARIVFNERLWICEYCTFEPWINKRGREK